MRIEGIDRLRAVLRALPEVAKREIAGALVEEAESIRTDSQQNYVPVDTGTLRSSAHVRPPEHHGGTVSVEIGYGGAASAYALIQHERTDFAHPGGGQAKYLERPALAAAAGMESRLARRLKARLERAG